MYSTETFALAVNKGNDLDSEYVHRLIFNNPEMLDVMFCTATRAHLGYTTATFLGMLA